MDQYLNKIICGDCLDVMRGMPDKCVDSIVTDPPYGLKFMGKAWDHGVPGVEFWEEALRVCKPGAHMLAFGGTRTHHRLMVAIEDAGWEIRDCLGWIHGQGFPKGQDVAWEMHKRACNVAGNMVVIDHEEKTRLDIDKQLSETQHKMRFVRATYLQTPVYACAECGQVLQPLMSEQEAQELRSSWSKSETIWPEQPRMEGGNNLETPEGELQGCEICKMSHRILADGSEGWIHHGASACNGTIPWQTPNKDGSRPSYRPQSITQYDKQPLSFLLERTAQTHRGYNVNLKPAWEPIVLARKPLDGTVAENVQKWGVGALNIDGCRVGTGDTLNGGSGGLLSHVRDDKPLPGTGTYNQNTQGRFPANIIHDGSDEVLEVFPETRGQQGEVIGTEPSRPLGKNAFGMMIDRQPFSARNDSGSAARFFYCAKASSSERGEGNTHPTVKPINLIRYLVRLITPPQGIVLDMFGGSGTTALACYEEGPSYVLVDQDLSSVEIAEERIRRATAQTRMFI